MAPPWSSSRRPEMLRAVVTGAAIVALAAALIGFALVPASWPMLLTAGVVALGVLAERVGYAGTDRRGHEADWEETPERFRDEASGRPVVVWYNRRTGERRYVDQA